MERKLRIQLTVSVFAALVLLLGIILLITSAVHRDTSNDTADAYLAIILESDGELPESPSSYPTPDIAEGIRETRFFVVWTDKNGQVSRLNLESISSVDDEEAARLAKEALEQESDSGDVEDFRYLRKVAKDGSAKIAFLDRSRTNQDQSSNTLSSAIVMLAGAIGVTIVFALLSKSIVAPIVRSQESQQQFVVDAGHDLRTPVSIISADADVLAMDIGEDNEWLQDIKHQVQVMSDLTESLIVLSRSATADERRQGELISLSEVVAAQVQGFQSRSLVEKHPLEATLDSQVEVRGNQQNLSRMVGALIDNAFKYSSPAGSITIALDKGRRAAQLRVSNPVDKVDPEDMQHWFDRFYQADQSRQHKAGGYGIGLSMVRAVAEAHHGKVSATAGEDGKSVIFTVTLPLARPDRMYRKG